VFGLQTFGSTQSLDDVQLVLQLPVETSHRYGWQSFTSPPGADSDSWSLAQRGLGLHVFSFAQQR
jgi:hypothetical protein